MLRKTGVLSHRIEMWIAVLFAIISIGACIGLLSSLALPLQ